MSRPVPPDTSRLQRIEWLSYVLDNAIRIPIINYRIGYDVLIGLVPGLGDVVGLLFAAYIVFEASRFGLPTATLLRMVFNVVLEVLVGAIPVLGDLFDATWKANARNLDLLCDHLGVECQTPSKANRRFVVGMWAVLMLTVAGLVFLLVWAVRSVSAQPVPTTSRVFYVAPNGDDAGDGSATTPWATLQHAADQVEPGDTVRVRAGTYVGFQVERSGTADQPIVFKAEASKTVVDTVNPVRGQDGINVEGADYVVIDGFRVRDAERAGIRVVVARGVVVKHNVVGPNGRWGIFTGFAPGVQILGNETFGSADEHGIYVSNSDEADDQPVVRGNLSYGNEGNGIQLNGDCFAGGDGVIEGAVVEANVVWNNRFKGLSLISIAASRIQNNLIYENGRGGGAGGIHLVDEPGCGAPTTGTVVVNNTIVEPRIAGVRATDGATDNILFNNLIVSDRPIRDEVGGNQIDESSTLTAGTTVGLFQDAPAGDYHLAAGAPARDAGRQMFAGAAAPSQDLDGSARPQGDAVDVGAYEASAASTRWSAPPEIPATHVMSPVVPNPAQHRVRWTLTVRRQQHVRIAVYDAHGRRVGLVHDGILTPRQSHSFALQTALLSSGVYVIRAGGATFAETRCVIVVR